jgi:hypothetical protein
MYIVDTHCDSLLTVNAENGLANKHNISVKYPHLQLFAEFVPCKGMTPEYRRKRIFNMTDVYIAECQRLGIYPVRDTQELNYAVENGLSASPSFRDGAYIQAVLECAKISDESGAQVKIDSVL